MENQFLADFMRRQASLVHEVAEEKPAKGKKGKSKHGTADGKPSFPEDEGLAMLIREKPKKKVVLNYFKERIQQLCMDEF